LIQIKIEGTAAFKMINDTKEKILEQAGLHWQKTIHTTKIASSNLINPQNLEYLSVRIISVLVEITPIIKI